MASLAASRFWTVPRSELLTAIAALGLANSLFEAAYLEIARDGIWVAVGQTLGISAIVWISAFLGIEQLWNSDKTHASNSDFLITASALVGLAIPSSKISWVVLTILCLYLATSTHSDSARRRGASILIAITFPMFWSKLIFAMLSRWLLTADASLVGWITGLKRSGNTLQLNDGYGFLWIASGCSSLTNVSLAVLCSTVFVILFKQASRARVLLTCVMACVAVIAINAARISLIALHPDHWLLLHGPVGSTVSGWLTNAAIVGLCAIGLNHESSASR